MAGSSPAMTKTRKIGAANEINNRHCFEQPQIGGGRTCSRRRAGPFALGADRDRSGGKLELHGNRSAKHVQDWAMRINHLFELLEFRLARRALQGHCYLHPGETRTHAFVDGEKSLKSRTPSSLTETLSSGIPSAVA